jgi:hypothetical protein
MLGAAIQAGHSAGLASVSVKNDRSSQLMHPVSRLYTSGVAKPPHGSVTSEMMPHPQFSQSLQGSISRLMIENPSRAHLDEQKSTASA